jgi:hypothetical protein
MSEHQVKPIQGARGFYVSTLGTIWKETEHRISQVEPRGYNRVSGYQGVSMQSGSKWVNIQVHRAVAIAFLPNPDNKPQVNHIDNDPTNNNVDNLEWCTAKENMQHANKQGRLGVKKLSDNIVLEIDQKLSLGGMPSDVAEEFGISYQRVLDIAGGRSYQHLTCRNLREKGKPWIPKG